MSKKYLTIAIISVFLFACVQSNQNTSSLATNNVIDQSLKQLDLLIEASYAVNKIPRTVEESGEIKYTPDRFDWTEGFFPGTLWYAYLNSKDKKYLKAADHFQNKFYEHRLLTTNHDLGFVFNNSYGAAYRITKKDSYKQTLTDAANSLIQRYNPNVGCIKSWDVTRGWQAQRGWKYPVIIDNMMNLEMLFEVSNITGDEKFKNIAIDHANTTLDNHFRDNSSSYHVVDYDPETGAVRNKHTAQGYAHESAWARGQAWGLYGFTICYRYTKDVKYLQQAEKIAEFYLNNKNLPEDMVPYWDFDAPKIPNEPRDASAAAIVASALIELNTYSKNDYLSPAKNILKSLASTDYSASIGSNHNFILMHSVGSIPHGNEIDVPLNYADYYFMEALTRLKDLKIDKI